MPAKIRVAFLGSRPLGHTALTILKNLPNVEIVATVAKQPSSNAWWDIDPFSLTEDPNENHDHLNNIDFDFGVSVNYWKIIESHLVSKPRLGFINLHHSFNLHYRGRDMTSHAILDARATGRWYHGTALHYTDDGLDTGPVIESRACSITEQDTAWSLFQKVEELGKSLLHEWIPRLILARAPVVSPPPNNPLNKKTTHIQKYIENINKDPLITYDTVRAFDFNGHYPPAFTVVGDREVKLTTRQAYNTKAILKIDDQRIIYQYID